MRSVLAFLALSGLAVASKVTTHRPHTGLAHHAHGEHTHANVHRPVRKSLLRFPLRKVANRRRVVSGESTVKTAALFKLPSWLSRRRPHHHHGEHTHAHKSHHAHGEHAHHHHGKALVKRVRSAFGLFKLPSFFNKLHRHGEHAHGRPLLKRITKRVARLGEEVLAKERSLVKKVKSTFGLFKLPSWLNRRRPHRHSGEHTHHRHGENTHRALVKRVAGKAVKAVKSLGLLKKSARVAKKLAARSGEGEEVIRKTNKKALDRKALRKARKAAEKRRRLHKRANKKVTKKVARAGEGEEVIKRVAKKTVKKATKPVKALGLFELSNLLNLNQF